MRVQTETTQDVVTRYVGQEERDMEVWHAFVDLLPKKKYEILFVIEN